MSGSFVNTVIQPIIFIGYGLAADFLGVPFNHYRPMSNGAVISNINLIEQLPLGYDRDPLFSHKEPQQYGLQQYYALGDMTNTLIGDYFSDGGEYTFFCNNIEPLKPAMIMRCNRTVTVKQPAAGSGGLTNGYVYGGDTTPTTLLTGWPCSIISGGVGGKNEADTPGSVKDHGVQIYLPFYVEIPTYSVVIDDTGRRYVVGENEQTELGYKLLVSYETA